MKTTKKIAIAVGVTTVLGLAGVAGTAFADSKGYGWRSGGMHHGMEGHGKRGHHGKRGYGRRMMERFDTNEDGKVTRAEVDEYKSSMLTKFDADKDGKLSLKEFEGAWLEMMRPRMVRRFQFFDIDGDASVTAKEIDRPINRMFKRMDRNEDGEISKEDRRRHGKHRGGNRHRGGDRSKGGNKSE